MANRAAGPLWGFLAVAIWAGWFAVTRLGVSSSLAPADLVLLRLLGGSVALGPMLLRSRLGRRDWLDGAVLSVCWGAPFLLLLTFGIKHTSTAHSAALTPGTAPVFSLLLSLVLGRRLPRRAQVLGTGLILAGVALLLTVLPLPDAKGLQGMAALLLGAAMWACYGWQLRRSRLNAMQGAAMISVLSLAVFLPPYLLSGAERLTQASLAELALQAGYQGLLAGVVALVAYNRAIALVGPAAASAIGSMVPVLAMLMAGPILGEWPGPLQLLAALAITAGVYISARPAPAPGTETASAPRASAVS